MSFLGWHITRRVRVGIDPNVGMFAIVVLDKVMSVIFLGRWIVPVRVGVMFFLCLLLLLLLLLGLVNFLHGSLVSCVFFVCFVFLCESGNRTFSFSREYL